jgi:tetrapyrrole methylase family protein/MazG family protein
VNQPTITVVGLGPGGTEHVTSETLRLIDDLPHRYLRTGRHPSAGVVSAAETLDRFYELADTFDEVYRAIVEHLVAEATRHSHILYAVPGSPFVLERTVRLLMDDERVTADVRPAMSFLDVAYARLGLDPIEAGIRLIDGHEFATAAAGYGGPMLIAHAHANWVLSDIKLAAESADPDTPVVIMQRLGTEDEALVRSTWANLDKAVEADHLTSVFVPGLGAPVATELARFHELARTLRERCPWDREQTHESLVRYLVEETYELIDALHALDPDDPSSDEALIEELGDVLYQIEFHATIAEQQGRFTMADVARTVHDKLVRRHPHVFADVEVDDADQVATNWETIKRQEKQRGSVFDGVASSQPALSYADAIQRRAAKVGFDWPDVHGALPKVAEEAAELVDAGDDPERLADELGDLLFAVVNVARHLGAEPETALRAATQKFRDRFARVEELAAAHGVTLADAGLAQLDAWWVSAKKA